jgi:phosphohistidine phosphatase
MQIYLMRHAEAVSSGMWESSDMTRPLTDLSKAVLTGAVTHMKRTGYSISTLLTSPFKRAQETSEIIAGLSSDLKPTVVPALASGTGYDSYRTTVIKYQNNGPLLLVGHNPEITVFIARLLGDLHIIEEASLETGEMVAVETGPLDTWGQGKILWRRNLKEWEKLK